MKTVLKLSIVALVGIASTSCASLNSKKTLKAPCGPTAGMTDPCGNRTPINKNEHIVEISHGVPIFSMSIDT